MIFLFFWIDLIWWPHTIIAARRPNGQKQYVNIIRYPTPFLKLMVAFWVLSGIR